MNHSAKNLTTFGIRHSSLEKNSIYQKYWSIINRFRLILRAYHCTVDAKAVPYLRLRVLLHGIKIERATSGGPKNCKHATPLVLVDSLNK